jgi:hypothetical protein
MLKDVVPGDGGAAGGGWNEAAKDPHGGAFARSIGTEEPDDFTFADFEADIVDRGDARVSLAQIFNFYHRSSSGNQYVISL